MATEKWVFLNIGTILVQKIYDTPYWNFLTFRKSTEEHDNTKSRILPSPIMAKLFKKMHTWV